MKNASLKKKYRYFYLMKHIFGFCILFCFWQCSAPKEHPHTYYFWKTKLALDAVEKQELAASEVPYLYVRYFDVDKVGNQFQPVGVITKDDSFTTTKEIVPTIFLTNRSLYAIRPDEIPFLAKSILGLIKKKNKELRLKISNEIQIDCDWTEGTKADYFAFIEELKKQSGKEVTSTLRLHQVKDSKKMGVPPVNKVYLMCYSTSSPLENSTKNSILDIPLMKKYLVTLDQYPIKNISVALPIYSWGIITNHVGKHKLINALSTDDLHKEGLKKISENKVEVEKDGFYFGFFLNKGFQIKVEEISPNQLEEATAYLDKKLKNYDIVYYQLDRKFVKNQIPK